MPRGLRAVGPLAAATWLAGCNALMGFEEGTPPSPGGAGAGGAEAGGSAGSSSGGSGAAGHGGMGAGGSGLASACGSGTAPGEVRLFTTLDDLTAVTSPALGSGVGVQLSPEDDFVATPNGRGMRIDAMGEYLRYSQGAFPTHNVDPRQGAVDFCYQPNYHHTDDDIHGLLWVSMGTNDGLFVFKGYLPDPNALVAMVFDGTTATDVVIPATAYGLTAGTWVRVTASWQLGGGPSNELRLYLDGQLLGPGPAPVDPAIVFPPPSESQHLFVGSVGYGTFGDPVASGIIDEIYVYGAPVTP